jgi:hypothetical protein
MNNQKEKDALKDVFDEAAKHAGTKKESSNLESVKASNDEDENEKLVNLGVKIPAKDRNYWNGKAAAAGVSMKSIIVDALEKKYGKPE